MEIISQRTKYAKIKVDEMNFLGELNIEIKQSHIFNISPSNQ